MKLRNRRLSMNLILRASVGLTILAPLADAQVVQWPRQFGSVGTGGAHAVATATNAVYSV